MYTCSYVHTPSQVPVPDEDEEDDPMVLITMNINSGYHTLEQHNLWTLRRYN
jgi:hypothetical protein